MRVKQETGKSTTNLDEFFALIFKDAFDRYLAQIQAAANVVQLSMARERGLSYVESRSLPPYTATELVRMRADIEQAVAKRQKELNAKGLEEIKAIAASLKEMEKTDELLVPQPPRALEGILCLVTPREKQNELKGQLAEAYSEWVEEYDEPFARVLYCKEVCRSFAPVLGRGIAWLAKYKIMHYLGEIIGRLTQH